VVAEQKFAKASEYAVMGRDERLSNACWVDCGNKYRKEAIPVEDPREALEVYKHAIQNFMKASNEEMIDATWSEAAEKFHKKGMEIEKTKKNLIHAIDNYAQAATLFSTAKREEKTLDFNTKIDGLCEIIGLPLNYITNYLVSQNLNPVSV
jgi:hypothetical protein